MKKIIFIFVFLLLTIQLYALQDSSSLISDFTAKIKKNQIFLSWKIKYHSDLSKIRLEVKGPGEYAFRFSDEINIDNYSKKTETDNIEFFEYNSTYKPDKNGVYFFRIKLTDKNYSIKSTDEIKIGVSDIKEFKLHQNSPNPFNPTTTIEYELFTASKVLLKVYSLDGKEIETLVDELQQPGNYRVDFTAGKNSELSSGIYFYKLQTNHSFDIKKMIFTK